MRDYIDIIEGMIREYQLIDSADFDIPDFTNGTVVGKINTKAGVLEVWKREVGNEVAYGAVDPKQGPDHALGFVGFLAMSNGALLAKNASTRKGFDRKGIQSELFLFVNAVEKKSILSDTQMTAAGVALWDAMKKSAKFTVNIIYIPTSERFTDLDVGTQKTADGRTVIDPKDDDFFPDFYDPSTGNGQRFFFLMEHRQTFEVLREGVTYRYGVDRSRHLGKLIQPYGYFEEGDL